MREVTYASINVRVYLDHADHTWEKKKNPSNSKKDRDAPIPILTNSNSWNWSELVGIGIGIGRNWLELVRIGIGASLKKENSIVMNNFKKRTHVLNKS
jgi:hypothetical protein